MSPKDDSTWLREDKQRTARKGTPMSKFFDEGESAGKDFTPDAKQLKLGIRIEAEHSSDPAIQRKIAMDHLAEHPKYYTALDKMEKELEKNEVEEPGEKETDDGETE